MARVSVIIPVYRAEKYLRACLDSVLGQSYRDLEVIAVDDGSPDGSAAICREYAARDPRLRLLRQENAGQSAARNLGLDAASGEWVCFVDSDDAIHPEMVERLYQAAAEGGCGISQCRMLEGAVCPPDFGKEPAGAYRVLAMDEPTLSALFDQGLYPGWVSCAKLIRREIVLGYPFRPGRVFEDNEAVCRWLVAAGRMADIPEALYFYRTNPESTTQGAFSLKKLDYLWALESILTFYGGLGWERLTERFLEKYVEAAAGCYYGAKVTLSDPGTARRMERNTWRFLRRQGLHITQRQMETLLDTMHPGLLRLYWPVAGAARTLRTGGIRALAEKIRRNFL